jgi:hypothetical protein
MSDKLNPPQQATQPNENNGGAKAPINTSTGNPTKQPGTGAKKEPAWKGYGKMP